MEMLSSPLIDVVDGASQDQAAAAVVAVAECNIFIIMIFLW
jgi:hypothetical protein